MTDFQIELFLNLIVNAIAFSIFTATLLGFIKYVLDRFFE